jgi:hypothetical protein
MGDYDLADIHLVLGALEETIASLGRPAHGSASAAATAAWNAA